MAFNQSSIIGLREVKEEELEVRHEGRDGLKEKTCVGPLSLLQDDFIRRLPEEIVLDIISRLPVESVLHCRLQCKTWRNLLPLRHDNNTYFVDMHLRRQIQQRHHHQHNKNCNSHSDTDTKLSFVFFSDKSLYYVEYDENAVQSNHTHKRITLPLPPMARSLVGSCNGLICLGVWNKSSSIEPLYICNPITRELLRLPRSIIKNKYMDCCSIAHGFGYHPSTNEYKVVRVYYCLGQRPIIGQVQVYTLGNGIGWRNKGETTHLLKNRVSLRSVLLDGALHWLSDEGKIVAFELADEEFHCLPVLPDSPSPGWYYDPQLWVMGGWLCVVHRKEANTHAEIWLLKKNKKLQFTSINVQSWSWCREFTIEFDDNYPRHQPFSISKSGEILLLYKGKSIICCDPKPVGKPKKLGDVGEVIYCNGVISYFNSFVSLKALGGSEEIL